MAAKRKCYLNQCAPECVNASTTVECNNCKRKFHLPCYDIIHPVSKLFVSPNIVFLCNDCLLSGEQSPNRKRKNAESPRILRQTVLSSSCQMLPSSPAPAFSTSPLTSGAPKKQATLDTLRSSVEKLSKNCAKSSDALMASMDLMFDAISSIKTQLTESVQKNDADFSTVTKSIADKIDAFGSKQSFADVLSASMPSSSKSSVKSSTKTLSVANKSADKKDTAAKRNNTANKFKGHPLISGTSAAASEHLGKEVVITKRNRQKPSVPASAADAEPKLSKALYVTRFEPTVTADGLLTFLHARIENLDVNKIMIRMLVKKDQDLKELSFISFRILCTEDLFATLNAPEFWPSYIKMREFVIEQKKPRVDRVTANGPAKLGDSSKDSLESNASISHNDESPKNVNLVSVKPSSIANTPSKTFPATKNVSMPAVHSSIIDLNSPEQMKS